MKTLTPVVRFTKFRPSVPSPSLTDRISGGTDVVPAGEVMVILSRKNVDNIAKYHILNRSSNLYFYGSLPDDKNDLKHEEFTVDGRSLLLTKVDDEDDTYRSIAIDENGKPLLEFKVNDVYTDEAWNKDMNVNAPT